MVVLILLMLASPSLAQVAVVDGKTYSVEEFRRNLEALPDSQMKMIKESTSYRLRFLNHMINNDLLAKEAEKSKVHETDKFKKKLAIARRDLLANEYIERSIRSRTSDNELEAYFKKNSLRFSDEEVRASHILFKHEDKSKAENVLKEVLAGGDFASRAKKYSIGPSGPKGGDLSFFRKGRMVPAFDKVVFSLPKGKVHDKLVETQFGWHIVKVTDIRGGKAPTFKQKKDVVKGVRREEIRKELINELRTKAKVRVFDELVESAKI